MYQNEIEMKWKNEEDVKKNETITNLFIEQNDYEKINHLMSDWSSNWENNNINYEKLLLTIKKYENTHHRVKWTVRESKKNTFIE